MKGEMLAGYVELTLLLLAPGVTLVEIFRLMGSASLAERLGLAFGLGLTLDVLTLVIRTSGLQVAGHVLIGIDPLTIHVLVVFWLAVLGTTILLRRKLWFWRAPTRACLGALSLTIALFVLVVLHFNKYPIFPEFPGVDTIQHIGIASAIATGTLSTVPGGLLYNGVHVIMASTIVVTGDPAVVVVQYSMGILVTFSALLVYAAAVTLYDSKAVGLVATIIYVGGGSIWFGYVFDVGLFPNFYGMLAALTLIVSIGMFMTEGSAAIGLVYILALAAAMFSHYSILMFFPALLVLPLLQYASRTSSRAILTIVFAPLLVILIMTLADKGILTTLLGLVPVSGASAGPAHILSYFQDFYDFSARQAIGSEAATIVLLTLSGVGIYKAARGQKSLSFVCIVWLFTVLIVAPFGDRSLWWRFSYEALVPLTFTSAAGTSVLLQRPARLITTRKWRRRGGWRTITWRFLICFLILTSVVSIIVLENSYSEASIRDSTTTPGLSNESQHDVWASFLWIENSPIPPNASQLVFVSVTDPTYAYFLQPFTGRTAVFIEATDPQALLANASANGYGYVIITQITTVQMPPSYDPFQLYSSNSQFKLVYQNQDVNIYRIVQ